MLSSDSHQDLDDLRNKCPAKKKINWPLKHQIVFKNISSLVTGLTFCASILTSPITFLGLPFRLCLAVLLLMNTFKQKNQTQLEQKLIQLLNWIINFIRAESM